MRNETVITAFLVLLSLLLGIYLYPSMPEQMASHWGLAGEVNGYMPKFWGLFLLPFVMGGLFLLFVLIPKIDPLKKNIKKFMEHYERFVLIVVLFMFYVYILTLLWNMGMIFDMGQLLTPAFGILLYYCGIMLEKAKRNWFIGIRTPWTMSDDRVWEKTHRLGGKLFKISGLIALLGILFPELAFILVVVPILVVAIFTVVYSYFEFKRLKRRR